MNATLRQLGYTRPDEHELLWQFIGTRDLDTPLDVVVIAPEELRDLNCNGKPPLVAFKKASDAQQRTVAHLMAALKAESLTDAERTIVLDVDRLLDGMHRTVAAIKAGVPLLAVDISELPA